MAVFTFSEPQKVFVSSAATPGLLRRMFDAMVNARMAQAQREVREHIATLDSIKASDVSTKTGFDIDRAVVGKNGVYAWPY